jgi:ubiquinone/menaquinone biosynthesis C-methylase UbiE
MATFDPDAFRDFERDAHDRLAASYQKSFTPITVLAIEALLDAAVVSGSCSVLDVACGPGLATAAAAGRGARAIGVDLSPKMIDLARRLYPSLTFKVADVLRLPFPAGSFDAVVCNFGLGHFPRPDEAIAECLRMLKPGGRIALAWWDHLERQRLQAVFRDAIAAVGAPPAATVPQGHNVFRFSDSTEFEQLLKRAGLREVVVRNYATNFDFADADALWTVGLDSLAVTSATIANADPGIRAAIRGAFEMNVRRYLRQDGVLRIPLAYKVGRGHVPETKMAASRTPAS